MGILDPGKFVLYVVDRKGRVWLRQTCDYRSLADRAYDAWVAEYVTKPIAESNLAKWEVAMYESGNPIRTTKGEYCVECRAPLDGYLMATMSDGTYTGFLCRSCDPLASIAQLVEVEQPS